MKFTIIIISFFTNYVFSQNLNESEIYNFIKNINKNEAKFNLESKMETYPFTEDNSFYYDTIFSKADLDTFKLQLEKNSNFYWNEALIHNSKIISSKELKKIFREKKILRRYRKQKGWKKFRKKYGNCLTNYSLPLFSTNNQYCIFYEWTQCHYLMGSGSTSLYKKINGEWTFVKFYMTGIS